MGEKPVYGSSHSTCAPMQMLRCCYLTRGPRLHDNAHPLGIPLGHRAHQVHDEVYVAAVRLKELQLVAPEQRRQGHVHIHHGQMHADAYAGAPAKGGQIVRQPVLAVKAHGIAQPPLRLELVRIREDIRVDVDVVGVHADSCAGGNLPPAVRQGLIAMHSRQALDGAEGQPQG
ncbi:hypothetical protein BDV10DRAFT_161222 [Aspergillus recurvatus]